MEKWKRYVVALLVILFVGVGYMFYSKEPETTMVEEFTTVEEAEAGPVTEVVVYVTGAVEAPDTYTMPQGARVGDVLSLAVLTDEADPEQLNLAQLLVDGTKITVPKQGEAVAVPETDTTNGIHVNSATKEELMTVPGIGPAKADAILNYLKENGPFKSYDELGNVKGFGEKTLESMEGYLLVP
ncbi:MULTISPECIES: helix-hairpin-helix domain-containing protein [Exiguobacterium]|uniref:helix-hairpin-helix domain-containing protein n=1 Tax=Exiguobacterium TaxID=33986 RepID=UPI00087770D4|nr:MULTISPECIES: helix-hairpin-helix domain-containing protein [Exiguobacterium]TCI25669.1 competence protein ComEA [Exiguobacterium sp. SH5S4]TCI47767.1 competence protein ComEA [Exiguobacterium sp. SH5S32]TCI54651.1 competence protein ComEA [Exiguobacterium sp. SH1S4]TCI55675.1 competence protein ComEA [Exiguobacterium sp. SH5S13]TCI74447.1 competence protein ComEA [Exiguobacterium sp. SH1S1]